MRTSGMRVANRDISEAASPITSTRPTKGRATSREATSSRTRRRSSYTQTGVVPLPGPRILSSITAAPRFTRSASGRGRTGPGTPDRVSHGRGSPPGEPSLPRWSRRGSGWVPLPDTARPVPTLIEFVSRRQRPSPPGVSSRNPAIGSKSCEIGVFYVGKARAPAPCSRTPPPARSSLGGDMADIRRLPTPVAEVWDWQLHGARRGENTSLFFHPDGERGPARARRQAAAKAVCGRCPVIEACLKHALSVREPYGVWGGMSEEERARLIAAEPAAVAAGV